MELNRLIGMSARKANSSIHSLRSVDEFEEQ